MFTFSLARDEGGTGVLSILTMTLPLIGEFQLEATVLSGNSQGQIVRNLVQIHFQLGSFDKILIRQIRFLHKLAVFFKFFPQFLREKVSAEIALNNTFVGEICQTVFYQHMLFKIIDDCIRRGVEDKG